MTEMRNEVVPNLSWADYRAANGLNPSLAVAGLKSMKHLHHSATSQRVPTRDMRIGTVAHCLRLERSLQERFAIYEGAARRGKAYESFVTEYANGRETLLQSELEIAFRVVAAIDADGWACATLDGCSQYEASVFADMDGVQCKGRMDGLNVSGGLLVDLKCTNNIERHGFGRVFASLHYAFKLQMYRDMAQRVTGERIDDVRLVVVESAPPFDVAVVPVPIQVLDNERARVERVIDDYKLAKSRGYWPGVAAGMDYELVVPNWAMQDEELTGAEVV